MTGEPTRHGSPDDLAIALQNARREARTEISVELHDGVVQSMSSLMMRVAIGCIGAPPEVRTVLESVEMEMSRVVTELRDLVADLSSAD